MSYILEALKKSEKERGKNTEQNSASKAVVYPGYTKSDRKSNKRYIYVGLFVIMGCTLAYLLTPYLTARPENTGTTSSHNNTLTQPPSADASKQNSPAGTSIVIRPQVPFQQESAAAVDHDSGSWVEHTPENGAVYPHFNELPHQLKISVPAFTVAGHTYSEQPDQRMLILNNTIVKEGQAIANGLRLEEITWDGAILSFEKVIFRVNSAE